MSRKVPGSKNPLHSVFPGEEKYFLEFWSAVEVERTLKNIEKSRVQRDIYLVLRQKILTKK